MVVIDAQRTLLEFKLMSERAKADREIALATIDRLVGKDEGTTAMRAPSTQKKGGETEN